MFFFFRIEKWNQKKKCYSVRECVVVVVGVVLVTGILVVVLGVNEEKSAKSPKSSIYHFVMFL